MKNYALYYPTIEFQDYEWLWAASLLWDRIYKIVPKSYTPDEPDNIKILEETGEIGIPIHPDNYTKDIAEEFIDKLENGSWDAAALMHSEDDNIDAFTKVHHEKVDEKLRKILIAKGGVNSTDSWLDIPTEFSSQYMTYLANSIAEKNNLQLVTDYPAAWTCSTYFQYDGTIEDFPYEDLETHLATILIRDFIPQNLINIRPKEILEFREKRRTERERFFNSVKKTAAEISQCKDSKIIKDLVEDLKKDIHESLDDYKRSADILKVTGWTSIQSLSFPILTQIMGEINLVSSSSLEILSPIGIALGLITGISSYNHQMRKLEKENEYSYLLQLSRKWNRTYMGDDYTYFLNRQIEEFIND